MMNGCYKSFCNSNLDFLLSTLNPPPPPEAPTILTLESTNTYRNRKEHADLLRFRQKLLQ